MQTTEKPVGLAGPLRQESQSYAGGPGADEQAEYDS